MTPLWDRLIGQDRVRELLAAAADKPAGCYLFVGPPGVGKEEAARLFAAAILCPDRCGVCMICTRALKGTHPDAQWFEPEGFTYPLELIRELVASAAQTPLEAERRVIIIQEADRIVERSQNALLKALEEPVASVTWILIADALEPFLPTVLSRCQIVEFAALLEGPLVTLLRSRFDLTPEQAAEFVRAARGDSERALALAGGGRAQALRGLALDAAASQASSHWLALSLAGRVEEHAGLAREELREEQEKEASAFHELWGSRPGTAPVRRRLLERHKRAQRRAEVGIYIDFLAWLGSAFRDMAAISSGVDPSGVVNTDRAEDLGGAAAARTSAFWIEMVSSAIAGQLAIRENANPALAVQSVLLRLVA